MIVVGNEHNNQLFDTNLFGRQISFELEPLAEPGSPQSTIDSLITEHADFGTYKPKPWLSALPLGK